MAANDDRPPSALAANARRRMWLVIAVYSSLGAVIAWVADLPPGVTRENWRAQAWMTLAFVIANAIMTVYRIDRNNALRRTNETLTEMLYVVGLFWLAPWALVIGRAGAGFAAWHFTKMRWQFRIYNAVMYVIVSIVLVRTYLWIAPKSPYDGWRALAVALSVWFLNDAIRIGAHVILDAARHDRLRLDVLWPSLNTSYLRLIACAFGLLIAAAMDTSTWQLLAVATVGVLFVVVSKANSRAASLDAGIDQISQLSAATANARRPEQVEQELLRSVEAFGRLETVAIATLNSGANPDRADPDRADPDRADPDPADPDPGDDAEAATKTRPARPSTTDDVAGDVPEVARPTMVGLEPRNLEPDGVHWSGLRRPGFDRTLRSALELVELADGEPRLTADHKGTVAVWSLDSTRRSLLVVESAETSADQSDLWTTVGHLVDHARLAIDTVYKSRRLTDLAALEYERARIDPLTHLPNRWSVLNEIAARLARPEAELFCVVLVELLGYHESVNVLGLDFGNSAVVAFAEHLLQLQTTSEVSYVGHVTAAQFVLLVSADTAGARTVAEHACAGPRFEHHDSRSADPFAHRVAVAGIATAGEVTTSAEELLRAAGIALDRAAHDEQIASFGATDAAIAERRMAIRFRLGAAIDSGHICPEFQPQISLTTGRVSGCEVLARWNHAELGPIRPTEFIPVSERSGQIERLTIAVAEQALDVAREWGDGEPFDLSINVSARSLDSPAFVRALAKLVDEVGRPTTSTTIEITESMLVDRASMTLALERMRELGFRISIDDFGTGYSALSYLDRLPADEVKIDQSMVLPISPDNPVSPVVKHLVELCHALGLSVCAEGIEDEYQLDVLRSLGCDVGQGYLFARSLTADAMTAWLSARSVADANRPTAPQR